MSILDVRNECGTREICIHRQTNPGLKYALKYPGVCGPILRRWTSPYKICPRHSAMSELFPRLPPDSLTVWIGLNAGVVALKGDQLPNIILSELKSEGETMLVFRSPTAAGHFPGLLLLYLGVHQPIIPELNQIH